METNEMTPEKSLQIMNDMIEKSRRDIMKKIGNPLIMWGTLVFVTSLAVWFLWQSTGSAAWNWLWFVMAVAGFASGPLFERKDYPQIKTFLGEAIAYIWLSFGIFSVSYALAAMFIAPLPITAGIALMLGLCISLTGTLTKLYVLSVLGFVAGIGGAVACSLIPSSENVTLVMTGMSVFLVLTGLILNFQYRHICLRS